MPAPAIDTDQISRSRYDVYYIPEVESSRTQFDGLEARHGLKGPKFCGKFANFSGEYPSFETTSKIVSLVLGLETSCPWPRERLFSGSRPLASGFFRVLGLGLESCILDSTSVTYCT